MILGIIGSGALGSLFAARLSALTEVIMLGHWPAQELALRTNGLTLIEAEGSRSIHKVAYFAEANQLPALDMAIVLVKARQTRRAALELAQALKPQGLAVTLQNGLGNLGVLSDVLGPERVAQGVTTQGATMLAAGLVRHAGQGPSYLPLHPRAVQMRDLAGLLTAAGLETLLTADMQPVLWGKLAVNAGINPLTALLNVRNGRLTEDPSAQALMCTAAEEAGAVAASMGITLPYASAAAQAVQVAAATAANISSMLQDVRRGVPTEIEVICGAVAQMGRLAGVPTPVNDELLRLMQSLDETGRRPAISRLPLLQALLNQYKE